MQPTRSEYDGYLTKQAYGRPKKEQDEVDLVLDNTRGRIVGIKVKIAATLRPKDFSWHPKLQAAAGDKFVQGVPS